MVPSAPTYSAARIDESRAEAPVERSPFATASRPVTESSATERAARELPQIPLPSVPPWLAAVLAGVLCGVVAVLLSWAAAKGCDAVRGAGTCGGFGLLALIVILVVEVLFGAILLKSWKITDPVSTAFLGVGLVAVIVMLFFLSSVDSVWMIVVIPVLSAIMFALSWWVTANFVEED